VEGITYPLQKLAQGADIVGDQFNRDVPSIGTSTMYSPGAGGWPAGGSKGSPLAATVANTALQSAPGLLFRGRASEAKAVPVEKPAIDPRAQIMADAQKVGLKFTPTQAGAKAGSIAEGLTGQAKLERSLSMKNAPVVNKLAAKDLGLPDDAVLTPARINELKAKANQAYSDVAKTGKRVVSDEYRAEIKAIGDRTGGESFKGDVPKDITQLKDFYSKVTTFTAKDAVSKIRQLRSEATANIKARNAPEQNAKGYVQREIADALDNELARHVESLGKADLVAKYQAARVQLAKVHSVEDALSGGNVSAKSLAQQLKRGVPLSGNLRLVAQTYGEFEKVLQNVNKIRDGNPFGVVDAFVGIAGAANSPPLAAAVLARPAVRGILASDRYQRGLAKQGARAPEAPAPANKLAAPAAANALSSDQRRRATR
jgi:hypothetical protein